MRFRQLHYFMALARYLNYKAASNALDVSQSGLSQQIVELEYELGLKLFERDKKGLSLTTAGLEFARRLPELFKLVDQSIGLMQNEYANASDEEILRIGFEKPIVDRDVSAYIMHFLHSNPDTRIVVSQYNFEELTLALNEDRIDLGFFLMPSSGFHRDITFQTISLDTLILAVRRDTLGNTDSISEAIASRPFFCFEKNAGGTNTLLSICHSMGIIPDLHFCDQIDELICNVESGLGVAILPKRYVESARHGDNLLMIDLLGLDHGNICTVVGSKAKNAAPVLLRFLGSLPRVESDCGSCLNTYCHRHTAENIN